MITQLHHLTWDHPKLGRIEETLCPTHDTEVHAALRVLGIGSMGRDEDLPTASCQRCATRMPARSWLRGDK